MCPEAGGVYSRYKVSRPGLRIDAGSVSAARVECVDRNKGVRAGGCSQN